MGFVCFLDANFILRIYFERFRIIRLCARFDFGRGRHCFALIDFGCVDDDERRYERDDRKIHAENDFALRVETCALFLLAHVLSLLCLASKKSRALHRLLCAVFEYGRVAHIGVRKSCVKFLIACSLAILRRELVKSLVRARRHGLNLRLGVLHLIVSLHGGLIRLRLILYGRVLRSLLQRIVEGIFSRLILARLRSDVRTGRFVISHALG